MKTSKAWKNSLHMKSLQLDCGFQTLISFSLCYWQLSVRSLIWTVATHLPDDRGPRFPPLHKSSSFSFCSFPGLCEDHPVPQPTSHSLLFVLRSVGTENPSLSKVGLPLGAWSLLCWPCSSRQTPSHFLWPWGNTGFVKCKRLGQCFSLQSCPILVSY